MEQKGYELNKVTTIGITNWRNKKQKFGIKDTDRLRHIYAIGKTGVGKSVLLQNLAINDIENNRGIGVLDPHGSTVSTLLRYVPNRRVNDIVLFDVTNHKARCRLHHPVLLGLQVFSKR